MFLDESFGPSTHHSELRTDFDLSLKQVAWLTTQPTACTWENLSNGNS